MKPGFEGLLDAGVVVGLPGVERLGRLLRLLGAGRPEEFVLPGGGDHDDALLVGDDQVIGAYGDAAAADLLVQGERRLLGAGFGDDAPGEDGEARGADLGQVADDAVHDEGGDAPALGDGADVAPGDRVLGAPALDHHHRTGCGPVDRRVQHQLVAGGAADGESRARDPGRRRPERPQPEVHDLFAAEEVGEGGR
ncbi:hypothetical protein SF12_14405 [Streptomyces sp. MBRL 601]|nr:hypothetical protein SF12_14405 [Streptomyces sp. MBRL 601]